MYTTTSNLFRVARLVDMKTVQLSHNTKASLLRSILQQQLAKNMRSQLDVLFTTKYASSGAGSEDVVDVDVAGACGVGSVGNSNMTTASTTHGKQPALSEIVFGDATPQRTLSTDEYTSSVASPSTPFTTTPSPQPSIRPSQPPKLVRTCSVHGGDKRKRDEEDREEEKKEDCNRLKRSRSISVAPTPTPPTTTKLDILPTTTSTTPTSTTPTTPTNQYTVVPVLLDGALRLVFLSAKATAQMTANGGQSFTNNLTSVLLSPRSAMQPPPQKPQKPQKPQRLASGKGSASMVQRVQGVLEASALVPAFAL